MGDVLKIVIFIVFVLTLLGIAVVVWVNRDSEQVISAAVPLAFGAASALALVFAFVKPGNVERVFPVLLFVDRTEKLPVSIPGRAFPDRLLALASQAFQDNPKIFEDDVTPTFRSTVYHHFLQRALIETISFRHFDAWRVEALRFDMGLTEERWVGAPDAEAYGKLSLSAADLKARMNGNRFAAVDSLGSPGTLVLPPGTTLNVEAPAGEPGRGLIHFSNWFCDLTIETTYSMAAPGLGQYPMITGITIDEAQNRFVWTQYIVRAKATFKPWLFGHPHMSAYRDWASGIIDDIVSAFDEQRLWRGAVDSFMLQQHLSGVPRLTVAPIRVTPKAPSKDPDKQ